MNQAMIFLPMGALAFLTQAVLLLIPIRRFRAGAAGQVGAEDFKLGESARVPPHVSLPNRAMMNLLELPMLFYVALRLAHSAIQLTYNNVMHRLIPFALSNVVLGVYWVLFFVKGA